MTVLPARATLLLCAALALAALATGCGGDGEQDATATVPSKAEYLQRANAACRKARQGLRKEMAEFLDLQRGRKPHPILLADVTQLVLLPTIENEMEAVRALKPPRGEEERINELLYVEELALTNAVYMARVPSIATIRRLFTDSARQLRAYGLGDCANGWGRGG